MKQTMSTYEIAHALLEDDNARWTRNGSFALAEYLEEYEEETGEEMEFDRVAIRCDWTESTAEELMNDHGEPEQTIEELIEYMKDNTLFIEVDNDPPTYIYQAF